MIVRQYNNNNYPTSEGFFPGWFLAFTVLNKTATQFDDGDFQNARNHTGKQGEEIKSMPRLNVAEEYEVNDFFKT